MDNESENSEESNLVIPSGRARAKLFLRTYWKLFVIVASPLILLPIAVIGNNSAYKCFYIFLVTNVYWVTDVMHPCANAMVPIALSTLIVTDDVVTQFFVRNYLVDCLGVMMLIIAIEDSRINQRLAVKMLLIIGCSHYRLSFLLFFFCTMLSMLVSETVACGLMMPLVKAILLELEKMGILEMYHNNGKTRKKRVKHEENIPVPTDYTVFYFLGIAYSSTIGSMGTFYGSHANQTFKNISETLFPFAPSIEFPHFMLLNLPGVLLMETLLYMWMNFYFMGMFRAQSEIALEIGMSEEEARYISTILSNEYQLLGKTKFQEWVVISAVLLNVTVHVSSSISQGHINIASPSILSSLLLFVIPVKLNLKFFKRQIGTSGPSMLPASRKVCLNWPLIRNNLHWSVLFILGSSCAVFDSLKSSRMTDEFYTFLAYFKTWPAPALALVIILFCKVFTEFAPSACLAHALLPIVGRLSVESAVNPHYLMIAAILGSSVPFHLMVGAGPYAMVARYVHISPWKMMRTGVGPSLIAVTVLWFTCTVWSRAIWPDINQFPQWAHFIAEKDVDRMP